MRYHLNDAISQGYFVSTDAPLERYTDILRKDPVPTDTIDLMAEKALEEVAPSEEKPAHADTFSVHALSIDGDYRPIKSSSARVRIFSDLVSTDTKQISAPSTIPETSDRAVDSLHPPSAPPSISGGPPVGFVPRISAGGPPLGVGGPPTENSGPPMGLSGPPLGFAAPPSISAVAPAILPTKPRISPGVKLKNIYWKRFLLPEIKQQLTREGKNSSSAPAESIWDSVNKMGDASIDAHEVERLFVVPQISAAKPVVESAKPIPTSAAPSSFVRTSKSNAKIRIVDDKRFNSMSIMLKRLPPLDQIAAAFRSLDDQFGQTKLAIVIQTLPTAEELQLIADSGVAEDDLDAPERFILMCSRFPQISARLDCWHFKIIYEELYTDLLKPLSVISSAIDSLANSTSLVKAFNVVLSVGNYLNGGTSRGQADGFDISMLAQLDVTRDTENKLNLVDFCAKEMIRLYGRPFLNQVLKDLDLCPDAAKYSLKTIVSDIHKFVHEVKNKKKMSTLVSVSAGAMDAFMDIMQKFNVKAEVSSSKLLDQCDLTHNAYIDLVRYFGKSKEFATRLASDDFFFDLTKFYTCLSDAAKKIDDSNLKEVQDLKNKAFHDKQIAAKAKTDALLAK